MSEQKRDQQPYKSAWRPIVKELPPKSQRSKEVKSVWGSSSIKPTKPVSLRDIQQEQSTQQVHTEPSVPSTSQELKEKVEEKVDLQADAPTIDRTKRLEELHAKLYAQEEEEDLDQLEAQLDEREKKQDRPDSAASDEPYRIKHDAALLEVKGPGQNTVFSKEFYCRSLGCNRYRAMAGILGDFRVCNLHLCSNANCPNQRVINEYPRRNELPAFYKNTCFDCLHETTPRCERKGCTHPVKLLPDSRSSPPLVNPTLCAKHLLEKVLPRTTADGEPMCNALHVTDDYYCSRPCEEGRKTCKAHICSVKDCTYPIRYFAFGCYEEDPRLCAYHDALKSFTEREDVQLPEAIDPPTPCPFHGCCEPTLLGFQAHPDNKTSTFGTYVACHSHLCISCRTAPCMSTPSTAYFFGNQECEKCASQMCDFAGCTRTRIPTTTHSLGRCYNHQQIKCAERDCTTFMDRAPVFSTMMLGKGKGGSTDCFFKEFATALFCPKHSCRHVDKVTGMVCPLAVDFDGACFKHMATRCPAGKLGHVADRFVTDPDFEVYDEEMWWGKIDGMSCNRKTANPSKSPFCKVHTCKADRCINPIQNKRTDFCFHHLKKRQPKGEGLVQHLDRTRQMRHRGFI